ncbi:MAG: hypothetical protein NZ516_10470, partial [Raineya sp.]|nr:hypothetical protein [Raineya sp.]
NMADLRALIEFIVAIVSAYFLIKIENVKQQKDIAALQERVNKFESQMNLLEEKQNDEIKEIHKYMREIRDMIQTLEIKILQKDRRSEH